MKSDAALLFAVDYQAKNGRGKTTRLSVVHLSEQTQPLGGCFLGHSKPATLSHLAHPKFSPREVLFFNQPNAFLSRPRGAATCDAGRTS